VHDFCINDGMNPRKAQNRIHAGLLDALIVGILILVWFVVTLGFLMLRLLGEKRMEGFFGLPKKIRLRKGKSEVA